MGRTRGTTIYSVARAPSNTNWYRTQSKHLRGSSVATSQILCRTAFSMEQFLFPGFKYDDTDDINRFVAIILKRYITAERGEKNTGI